MYNIVNRISVGLLHNSMLKESLQSFSYSFHSNLLLAVVSTYYLPALALDYLTFNFSLETVEGRYDL